MTKLRWYFSPEWNAWWLVYSPSTVLRGFGPFVNDFEIKCAADVHGVPFNPMEQP